MSKHPAVTVVMPAHNTEKYIGAAISSILAQTFQDFELWILENGSTDKTLDVANEFKDPRVKVFDLGAVGFQGALGYALEHAESDWIARMDSDDICLPTRLETQMQIVATEPEYVMVGTAYAILTPFGHIMERVKDVPSRELDKTSIALGGHQNGRPRGRICADPSMIFNRKIALEVGGYDSAFKMGDVPLWLRMLEGRKGWETAEPLYLYRLRPESFSNTHNEGIVVREKYTPELLDDFLTYCYGTTGKVNDNVPPQNNFWQHIGFLELLAGDQKAALLSADKLAADGNRRSAQVLKMRAFTSKLGHLYYSRKWSSFYRHRQDLERQVANLLNVG